MSLLHRYKKWLVGLGYALGIIFSVIILRNGLLRVPQVLANAAPTVDSVVITTSSSGSAVASFNLVENSTTSLYVIGSISDTDGCGDVKTSGTLQVVFYRSSVTSTSACSANNHNCYQGSYSSSECTFPSCSLGTEATSSYECILPMQYYADATDSGAYSADNWVAQITATDGSSASSSLTATTEMNSLLATGLVTISLAYGTLALNSTSSDDAVLTIKNAGNQAMDINISGSDITCDIGSIAVNQQHYATTTGQSYGSMTTLTATPTLVQLNVPPFTTENSTATLYFKISLPASGLAGSCVVSSTITAVTAS